MRKRFHVRLSDSVLDDEDFPISAIYIRHSCNGEFITDMQAVRPGAYSLPPMINWDLPRLFEWLKYDSTGTHPEEYHEIGLFLNNNFYPCDWTFNLETIDKKWMVCETCKATTAHDRDGRCTRCA
jgi:hypothetical protein